MEKERPIKNRDIPVLSRVFYTMQEIVSIEQRCAWQRDRIFSITQNLSGMPRGGGNKGGIDNALVAIETLQERQRLMMCTYVRELRKVEHILNSIESLSMRAFVTLMYVDQLPHISVRGELGMTEYGFNRARDAVESAVSMQHVVWREKFIVEK